MSKRTRATRGASSEDDEDHRRRNFSPDAKALCLALLDHGGSITLDSEVLARLPGFPGARTLRRWRTEAKNPPKPPRVPVPLGRPSLLNDVELMVMCGFVVFCAERHQTCGGKEIIAFVQHAFGVSVQKSWLTDKLKPLHITSHHSASLKYTYGGSRPIAAALAYLEEHQSVLAKVEPRARVVAVDEISFWDCGVTERTYSPEGAYVGMPVCTTPLTLPTQGPTECVGLRAWQRACCL
jgi:hypothetical protein